MSTVSDRLLAVAAKNLPSKSWYQLGVEMGIPKQELDECESSTDNPPFQWKFILLSKYWERRKQNGEECKVKDLEQLLNTAVNDHVLNSPVVESISSYRPDDDVDEQILAALALAVDPDNMICFAQCSLGFDAAELRNTTWVATVNKYQTKWNMLNKWRNANHGKGNTVEHLIQALGKACGTRQAIDKLNEKLTGALPSQADHHHEDNQLLGANANVDEDNRESIMETEATDMSKTSTASHRVFISYNWGIQEDVKQLKRMLNNRGINTWMDIDNISGGDLLYNKLAEGLEKSKVLISCVTKKYLESKNCRKEVARADSLKIKIIPLLFEKMDWPPGGDWGFLFSADVIYIKIGTPSEAISKDKFDELLGSLKKEFPDF